MRNLFLRICLLVTVVSVFITATGCVTLTGKGEDLLALPKTASTISQLQMEIDRLLDMGGEYSAPVAGDRRQSVQMEDLDEDDVEEALLFLRTSHEMPLKLSLLKKTGENYSLAAEVELGGTSFDTVSYNDINGDGIKEIIVGCSLAVGVPKALHVFSISNGTFESILSCTYNGYAVMDIDGKPGRELIVLRHDMEEMNYVAEVYGYNYTDMKLQLADKTDLSTGTDSLKRMRTGFLRTGEPAIFVSAIYNKVDLVIDICAYKKGKFTNIVLDSETKMSRHIVRQYALHGTDIDFDGKFDLPQMAALPEYEGKRSGEQFRKVLWYSYDINGQPHEVMQTYHNSSDGWYFILPEKWKGNLAVDRRDSVSGERVIVFSILDEDASPIEVLSIVTLTGDNKDDRSRMDQRFILHNSQTRIYAAKISTLPYAYREYQMDEETVRAAFKLIQTEWMTGELTP